MTHILIRHDFLNCLDKLGLSNRPNCRRRGALEKTSLHVLYNCSAYARVRFVLLGSAFLKL